MNSRKKLIAVAVIVAGALSYLLITGLVSYSMQNVAVSSVISNPQEYKNKGLQVSGTVVNGSINKTEENLTFNVKGSKDGAIMQVTYKGIVPDAFMEDASVILEGMYDMEHKNFVASKLMAKCPSRYEGMDVEEHNKAMADKNASI